MADDIEENAPHARTFAVTRTIQVKNSSAVAPNSGQTYHRKGGPTNAKAREALAVPAFYSGVRFLSETLAALPKRVNQTSVDPTTGKTIRQRVNHPITPLISQVPNAVVNALYLWETAFGHAIMYGSGYVWVERRLGQVVGLHNLHSLLVVPFRAGGRQFFAVRDWAGRPVSDAQGNALSIPAADMIVLRNFSEDGEHGLSVLDLLSDSLGIGRHLDVFLGKYFEEGSAVNLVVEAEKGLKDADIDTLKYGITENHKGLDNAHNVMILSGATAKNITPPLKDFAFDILKNASVDDVARVLRLDPTMLFNLSRATWANLEQLGTSLVNFSLGNWVRKAELECNARLLSADERASGFYVKFQIEHLGRGDFESRVKAGAQAVASGLLSSNEWREMESLDPRDGGDQFYSPPNSLPAGSGSDPSDPNANEDDSADPDTQPAPSASLDPAASVADATPLLGEAGEVLVSPITVSRSEAMKATFGRFLDDAVARVRRKQEKAFARPREDADEWLKTFSAEQGVYLAEALNPFVETAFQDGGDRAIVAQAITEDYTAAVSGLGVNADPDVVVEAVLRRIK